LTHALVFDEGIDEISGLHGLILRASIAFVGSFRGVAPDTRAKIIPILYLRRWSPNCYTGFE
jgi:hypothetical protein